MVGLVIFQIKTVGVASFLGACSYALVVGLYGTSLLARNLETCQLPKRNYQFEKRQKDLAKKQKKEEKRQRKLDRPKPQPESTSALLPASEVLPPPALS
jgi:hypothetical protein